MYESLWLGIARLMCLYLEILSGRLREDILRSGVYGGPSSHVTSCLTLSLFPYDISSRSQP